jgi:hypothetical protein
VRNQITNFTGQANGKHFGDQLSKVVRKTKRLKMSRRKGRPAPSSVMVTAAVFIFFLCGPVLRLRQMKEHVIASKYKNT